MTKQSKVIISERDLEIFNFAKQCGNYATTAGEYGITRERVRQIVSKVESTTGKEANVAKEKKFNSMLPAAPATNELLSRLAAYAEQNGNMSKAAVIRQAVEEFLSRQEEQRILQTN